MVIKLIVQALGFTVLGAALAAAQTGLEAAKEFYDQAIAESDPALRVPLLESSIAAQETFEARLALGETLLELSRHESAREQLKSALAIAATDQARARGTFLVGEAFLAQGAEAEALPILRRALALHPYPVIVERLKTVERKNLDRVVTSEEITRALSSSATRAFGVQPAVDLRIGFDFDRASLDPGGKRQASELGRALAAMDGSFTVVGHTDKQGDAEYNASLSLRRAASVKAFLVEEFGIDPASIGVLGRGESHLLFPGDDPEDHALNRRVEVTLE